MLMAKDNDLPEGFCGLHALHTPLLRTTKQPSKVCPLFDHFDADKAQPFLQRLLGCPAGANLHCLHTTWHLISHAINLRKPGNVG